MSRAQHALTIVTLSVALVSAPLSGTLFASESTPQEARSEQAASYARVLSALQSPPKPSPFTVSDDVLVAAATPVSGASQWGRHGGHRGGGGRNDGARTAIILGAIGVIAGSAVLVYANRPECGDVPNASGCGYGTKVTGGAVLAAGVVGITVGAATWR
jgi:hypothetical protein